MAEEITREHIANAINTFLIAKFKEKAEPELKKLAKAEQAEDTEQIAALKEKLAPIRAKYTAESWISHAAERLTQQLKFGTHLSKGVHPDSKGDNINFQPAKAKALPAGIAGSQTLTTLALDANRNAAALPLAAFFDIRIDEENNIRLRDLIQAEHPAIDGVFAKDADLSSQYAAKFKHCLDNPVTTPVTFEKNKQLLWPCGEQAITDDTYHCLIPLHPAALTHTLFKDINQKRYSEENKTARENRKKVTAEKKPYISITDLACIKLGGTKPQNIGYLTSQQSGRNYLLPSVPPIFKARYTFTVSKTRKTIFDKYLRYHCQGMASLFEVVKASGNVMEVREQRKQAVADILDSIIITAMNIQNEYPSGWSKTCQLDMSEKYWLDPGRAELEGEEEFAEQRQQTDWLEAITERFARWLNATLQDRFKALKHDIADAEHNEWRREIQSAIKASIRKKEGVFE